MTSNRFRFHLHCVAAFVAAGLAIPTPNTSALAEEGPVFSSTAADLGIVVADLERSAAFYTKALGCSEVNGFSVPAQFATNIGLVNQQALTVRVFTLGKGEAQTKLKVMAFPEAPGKKTNQDYIHSSIGFSYLTLHVTDLNAAIERLKKAKVKLEGKTPVGLGGNNSLVLCRDPDGNFIELIGPR